MKRIIAVQFTDSETKPDVPIRICCPYQYIVPDGTNCFLRLVP
jgi:hypothetical protein